MTAEEITQKERRERYLAVLRQMATNKKAEEQQAIERYKNDLDLQAFIVKLDQKNAQRGTPIA